MQPTHVNITEIRTDLQDSYVFLAKQEGKKECLMVNIESPSGFQKRTTQEISKFAQDLANEYFKILNEDSKIGSLRLVVNKDGIKIDKVEYEEGTIERINDLSEANRKGLAQFQRVFKSSENLFLEETSPLHPSYHPVIHTPSNIGSKRHQHQKKIENCEELIDWLKRKQQEIFNQKIEELKKQKGSISSQEALKALSNDDLLIQIENQIHAEEKQLAQLKLQRKQLKDRAVFPKRVNYSQYSKTTALIAHGLKGVPLPPNLIETGNPFQLEFRANAAINLIEEASSDTSAEQIQLVQHDLEGLKCICKHRCNLNEYSLLMFSRTTFADRKEQVAELVKLININIEALNHPDFPRALALINCLKDGSCNFCIPVVSLIEGEKEGHIFSIEFRKTIDQTGKKHFFLVIHNRGDRSPDPDINKLFHGEAVFAFPGQTKRYSKTTVEIEVSQKELMDGAFLEELVKASLPNSTSNHPYLVIHQYLLKKGGGHVKDPSEGEKLLEEIFKFLKTSRSFLTEKEISEILDQVQKLINLEPNYHSQQIWGSCFDSNFTSIEKNMALPSTQRILKLYTLMELSSEVALEHMQNNALPPLEKEVLALISKKIELLNEKIAKGLPIEGETGKKIQEIARKIFQKLSHFTPEQLTILRKIPMIRSFFNPSAFNLSLLSLELHIFLEGLKGVQEGGYFWTLMQSHILLFKNTFEERLKKFPPRDEASKKQTEEIEELFKEMSVMCSARSKETS